MCAFAAPKSKMRTFRSLIFCFFKMHIDDQPHHINNLRAKFSGTIASGYYWFEPSMTFNAEKYQ